jgi:hypothetical protein
MNTDASKRNEGLAVADVARTCAKNVAWFISIASAVVLLCAEGVENWDLLVRSFKAALRLSAYLLTVGGHWWAGVMLDVLALGVLLWAFCVSDKLVGNTPDPIITTGVVAFTFAIVEWWALLIMIVTSQATTSNPSTVLIFVALSYSTAIASGRAFTGVCNFE